MGNINNNIGKKGFDFNNMIVILIILIISTTINNASSYLLIGILFVSLFLLNKNKDKLKNKTRKYLYCSLLALLASQSFFIFNIAPHNISNLIGLILKLISYYVVYNLIIELNIKDNYKTLNNSLENKSSINQDLLRSILDSNKDGVIVTDNNLEILHMNKALFEIFSFPNSMFNEKNPITLMEFVKNNVKEPDVFMEKTEQIMNNFEVYSDLLYMDNNKVIERSYYPLIIKGEKSGKIWSFRDVTEKTIAINELEIKNKAIESSLNPFAFTDVDGTITYVNESFLKLWGYNDKSELLGMASSDLYPETTNIEKLRLNLLNNGYWFGQITAKKRDGSTFQVEAFTQVIYDNGKPISLSASFIDITKSVKVTSQLQKSRSLYKKLVDLLPDAVLVTKNNNLIIANESSMKLINKGISLNEIHIKSLSDLINIHPDYKDIVAKRRKELSEKNMKTDFMEQKLIVNNTILDVEVGGSSFTFEGDNYIVSVIRDISERKKSLELQKEVEIRERLLIKEKEYNKLKTQFFSTVSHEFKTPLNVILGITQLFDSLKKDLNNLDVGYYPSKYVDIMRQNCYRLLRLINNILDINKIDTGYLKLDLKNYNIVNIIEDISLSVVAFAKTKEIDLIFDTDVEEKIVACDGEKLERILLNLLSNAVKYTDKGGKITVNIYDRDDKVIVSVKDTGSGIPKDMREKIFEKFFQVDGSLRRSVEGTGIGLSLVKSLVELHGGSIYVESELGKGSEFIIELPGKTLNEEIDITKDVAVTSEANVERISIEFSDIYS